MVVLDTSHIQIELSKTLMVLFLVLYCIIYNTFVDSDDYSTKSNEAVGPPVLF